MSNDVKVTDEAKKEAQAHGGYEMVRAYQRAVGERESPAWDALTAEERSTTIVMVQKAFDAKIARDEKMRLLAFAVFAMKAAFDPAPIRRQSPTNKPGKMSFLVPWPAEGGQEPVGGYVEIPEGYGQMMEPGEVAVFKVAPQIIYRLDDLIFRLETELHFDVGVRLMLQDGAIENMKPFDESPEAAESMRSAIEYLRALPDIEFCSMGALAYAARTLGQPLELTVKETGVVLSKFPTIVAAQQIVLTVTNRSQSPQRFAALLSGRGVL